MLSKQDGSLRLEVDIAWPDRELIHLPRHDRMQVIHGHTMFLHHNQSGLVVTQVIANLATCLSLRHRDAERPILYACSPFRGFFMLVLGIDPGSQATGYAVVRRSRGRFELVDAGVIRTRSKDSIPERLAVIHAGLVEVILRTSPESVGIEAIFKHKSSESALRPLASAGLSKSSLSAGLPPCLEKVTSQSSGSCSRT